jgi:type III pantothenate kinase
MHVGVYKGIQSEIDAMIRLYDEKFDFLTIILTGGDAQRLSKPVKNSIFAHSNFIAEGLNFILLSNSDS